LRLKEQESEHRRQVLLFGESLTCYGLACSTSCSFAVHKTCVLRTERFEHIAPLGL
jgi:hypothetical protein